MVEVNGGMVPPSGTAQSRHAWTVAGGDPPSTISISDETEPRDPVVTITQDPKEKRCGPNVEKEFLDELDKFCSAVNAVDHRLFLRFSNPPLGPRGEYGDFYAMGRADGEKIKLIYELIKPGGKLDYKPAGRRAPTGGGGPGGPGPRCPVDCPATVTMCDLCLTHDTPGNFALGFACEYAGKGWMAPVISANNSSGSGSGSAGSGSSADDDQDTVAAGRDAGAASRNSERANGRDPKVKDKDAKNREDRKKAICDALAKLKETGPDHFRDCPECPE